MGHPAVCSISIIKVKGAQADASRRWPSRAHGIFCFFACFLLKTPPSKETCAWRTDEAEKRHPSEDQSDEGDGNHEGNELVGHVKFLLDSSKIFLGILLGFLLGFLLDLTGRGLTIEREDSFGDGGLPVFRACRL
jgi:hypothetical protein